MSNAIYSRTLADKLITDDDIKMYDTFILKDDELVPIPKWMVSSNIMKSHGKIVDNPKKLNKEIKQAESERMGSERMGSERMGSERTGLDENCDTDDKIIVFTAKISAEIWNTTFDNFTLSGLHDLLIAFQIFDIKLSAALQRKIAFNYLAEAKERGEVCWNTINSFDISVFEDCAFLCGTGILDMISKDMNTERLDSYFVSRRNEDQKIDPERVKKFLIQIKNFPKFESIIDVKTFVAMLEICFEMEYYYLFSEIYCTIISVPGSTYIFNAEVATIYNKWMNRFRVSGKDKLIEVKVEDTGYTQRSTNPKKLEFDKNERVHETFQHMAIKYTYIAEILNMYTHKIEKITLDPVYNFFCPCYMSPIRKHTTTTIDACDEWSCSCKSKILPIDKIKERLNEFVGGYLQDLDLSKSAITGSAMAICPIVTELEQRKGFSRTLTELYGTTSTKLESGNFAELIHKYHDNSSEQFDIKETESEIVVLDRLEQKYTKFKIISGTDVDILVNTKDTKEFDNIAKKHIDVIQKRFPQVIVKEITTHNGNHKYKLYFPKHEQRDVEIYQSDVDTIATYHMGCVRAYYSTIHGSEQLTCYPSYMITMFTGKSPDVRFVPGSKPINMITKKYSLRGIDLANNTSAKFTNIRSMFSPYHRITPDILKYLEDTINIKFLLNIIKISKKSESVKHEGFKFTDNIEFNICKSRNFYDYTNVTKFCNSEITPCYYLLQLMTYQYV